MSQKYDLSVVVPVYGCRGALPELCQRLSKTAAKLCESFEVIFVNDKCPQQSWEVISELAAENEFVRGIDLSRNFGQHHAISAGLDYALGDWVVVMDCDLQDKPEEIEKLYAKAKTGYDIVYAQRVNRQDGFLKRMSSRFFWRVFDYFTDLESDESIANFGIYSRKVVEEVKRFSEQTRSFPLFVRWLGFDASYVEIEHNDRHNGKSSYDLYKMLALASDIIVAHSNKPLKLFIKLGFLLSGAAFFYGFYLILRVTFWATPVEGWTSVMVSLYFLSGLVIMNLGVLGIYLGKIFNETKSRPLYVISEVLNLETDREK